MSNFEKLKQLHCKTDLGGISNSLLRLTQFSNSDIGWAQMLNCNTLSQDAYLVQPEKVEPFENAYSFFLLATQLA